MMMKVTYFLKSHILPEQLFGAAKSHHGALGTLLGPLRLVHIDSIDEESVKTKSFVISFCTKIHPTVHCVLRGTCEEKLM